MEEEDAESMDDEAEQLEAEAEGLRRRLRDLSRQETGQSGSGSQGKAQGQRTET